MAEETDEERAQRERRELAQRTVDKAIIRRGRETKARIREGIQEAADKHKKRGK